MKEIVLKVSGMMCNGCENRIQNALKQIDGVEDVKANHVDGNVKLTANDDINEEIIKETITDIGYEVE